MKIKLLETNLFNDNEYLDKYIELIQLNINNIYDNRTMQKHHILPRYYFKLIKLKIDNSKENIVNLSFKDHILAHYYLALASKNDKSKFSNTLAILRMIGDSDLDINDKDFIQSLNFYQELYEYSRLINSENHKGKDPWNKGLTYHIGPMEDLRKQHISEAAKDRYKNHIWIFNGQISKHIPKESLQEYLSQGYIQMRDPSIGSKISATQKLNPNKSMLGKNQSDYQKSVVSALFKNKPKSEEHRQKISTARLGKIKIINIQTNHKCYIDPDQFEEFKLKGYIKVKDLNKRNNL